MQDTVSRSPVVPASALRPGGGAGESLSMAPEALLALAARLEAAREPGQALDLLAAGLQRQPDWLDGWLARGRLAAATGDLPLARQCFERGLVLGRRRMRAWNRLLDFRREFDGLEAAAQLLREARAQFGDTEELALKELDLLAETGQHETYEATLWRARRRFPESQALLRRAIENEIEMGRWMTAQLQLAALPCDSPAQRHDRIMLEARSLQGTDDARAMALYAGILAEDPEHFGARGEHATLLAAQLALAPAAQHLRLFRTRRILSRSTGKPPHRLLAALVEEGLGQPELLAACQAALTGPLEPLLALMQANPGYTPLALGIMARLRAERRLRLPAQERGDGRAIPRVIAQFGPAGPANADRRALAASWIGRNPQWRHVVFDPDGALDYLHRHGDVLTLRAYRTARSLAERSEIFRLAWLFAEGGVYADAELCCIRALELVTRETQLLGWQDRFGLVQNNFLAACPGHPAIGQALCQAVSAVLRGDRDSTVLATGAGNVTRAVVLHLAESGLQALPRALTILQQHELRLHVTPGCWIARGPGGPAGG